MGGGVDFSRNSRGHLERIRRNPNELINIFGICLENLNIFNGQQGHEILLEFIEVILLIQIFIS